MTTGRRKSSANALRLAMQFARKQLCLGSRVSKLSIAATVFCTSAGYLQAQEKEPPRLFRGGLVQQLRSLTEESSASKTDEGPQRQKSENHLSDLPAVPKPRPANEKSRASTPTESRSANLRASQQPATRPAPQAKATTQPTTPNAKSRAAVETHSNAAASINPQAGSVKPNRPAELGIPVTNSKLANEARFQLNDKPDASAEGYSAKSKYDPAKPKEGATSGDGDARVFGDAPKVQAVESMSQAPKVSRKPLPAGSQATNKTAQKATEAPKEQATAPKSSTPPVGLKPMGGTYSLDDNSAPKPADPAPKPTEYPSLQTPSFAAPGATNAKNLAPTAPKLPQFPTPPAGLNNALALPVPSQSTPSQKSVDTKGNDPTRAESQSLDLPLPTNPSGLPGGGLPMAETSGSGTSYPGLSPNVPAPTTNAPSARGIRTESSNESLSIEPRATNPIRSNPGAARSHTPSADEHMAMETPRLQVLLKGPSDMPVGTPADYQVLVRNVDDIPLDGVILRLEIPNGVTINQGKPSHGELQLERTPDGATLCTWSFENLAAYQNASAPLQLTAKSARNFAVAMEWTLVPKNGETQIEVRQARLELALDGPSEAEYGVANMYRLHVRNPGTAVAKNVKVKLGAASFGASETQIAEILPGEQQSIDVELTFNEKGTISINAEADAADLHSAASINVLVKRALVSADIAGADRVYRGASSSYEVHVQNSGDLDSRTVRAELAIPEGAEVLNKPSNATLVNNLLTWDIPSIKAGEALAFPVELNLLTAGEHKLTLTTSTAHAQPSTAHMTTMVEAIADLKLVVNDPIAPAPVGGTVTYEMSITNRGSRAATNVRAVAQFSDGIEPVQADGAQHRIVTGQVIFEPLARIEAGETKVLRVQAKAAAAGTHRFRAEVRSDESDLRLVQEETTQYLDSASRIATPGNSGKVVR
ncbi:MAG: CARDB domain-containing protein [Pirellulaceae bacterium]|nr:CARDB domain-containing protein [Pirellulaceae bacterium]